MGTTPVDPAPPRATSIRSGPVHRAGRQPHLTARETAIIVLMAAGHTTPQIAELLDLRPRTVENHKRHIYEKLGVGNQNGAVAEAIAHGLLTHPGERRWPGEPGRPLVVLLRGEVSPCRDSVVHALVAEEVPFVSVWRRESLLQDHWARWHRGAVLTLLVDPEPDDWSWAGALNTAVVVVRAGGVHDRLAIVNALAHRASGLITADDVGTGLVPALRAAAAGLFAMSWPYTTTLSNWAPPALTAVPELTPRERDILGSIARGHTIRQTGRMLGIAAKTVENTQARLFRKLGARNRAETMTIARDLGLLDGSTRSDSAEETLFPTG
ncbi:MAG TPA: LuxR C-terminal-related transcriptional regulator [Pseudonocardiaceae bacterium]|jgi:DNA-binding CsgD family transcriptional regulator|nr:LuxR C-terminal-related transcriptional regulator [Pseudonocardiaceae bacterium]